MKLSDISYREYIAIKVFPQLVGSMLDNEAVWRAFGAADAFLKQAGKEYDKVLQAEQRAEKAETTISVLLNMDKDFGLRTALLQLWEMLGSDNQTLAVQRLRDLQERCAQDDRA